MYQNIQAYPNALMHAIAYRNIWQVMKMIIMVKAVSEDIKGECYRNGRGSKNNSFATHSVQKFKKLKSSVMIFKSISRHKFMFI